MSHNAHLVAFGSTRSAGPRRHPDIDNSRAAVGGRLVGCARVAGQGTCDALFFPDGLNSALSSVTERIGLVVTGSANLAHPHHLARQLLSLDHLGGGRAGWSLVTSFGRAAADNISDRGVVDRDERYDAAGQAIKVVKKLWDGWGEDTVVQERQDGIVNDVNTMKVAYHRGRHLRVAGPLGAARWQQGQPGIFPSGSSLRGRQFAARQPKSSSPGRAASRGGSSSAARFTPRRVTRAAHRLRR